MKYAYRCLLWLHPAPFRRQFEDEMLSIFEDARDAYGAASLFSDASISLLRQWLLRSGLWMWVVAGIVGMLPLMIAFGSFLPWNTPLGR